MNHVIPRYALRLNDFGEGEDLERLYKVWFDGLVLDHKGIEAFVYELEQALKRNPSVAVALFEPFKTVKLP